MAARTLVAIATATTATVRVDLASPARAAAANQERATAMGTGPTDTIMTTTATASQARVVMDTASRAKGLASPEKDLPIADLGGGIPTVTILMIGVTTAATTTMVTAGVPKKNNVPTCDLPLLNDGESPSMQVSGAVRCHRLHVGYIAIIMLEC